MTSHARLLASILLSLLLISPMAICASAPGDQEASISGREQRVMATRTFLNAHPDLKFRNEGWEAYQAGNYDLAIQHFSKASRYADKMSQAMLAEMSWKGLGVDADRPVAYAWADLAAELGYPQFIRLREQYWRGLDAAQRVRAVREGQALLSEYADVVARPRLAEFITKARQRMRRSSRSVSTTREVRVPDQFGGMVSIPSHRFYDSKFWDPREYQAWQDEMWKELPKGRVDVGDPKQVAPTTPP